MKPAGALNSSRAGRSSEKCGPSFFPSNSAGERRRPWSTEPGTSGYQSLLGGERRKRTELCFSSHSTISGPFSRYASISAGSALGPITSRTYRRATARLSFTPAARAWGLSGTQMPPPETDVVPPKCDPFSSTSTFAPDAAARTAAVIPAAPDPTTTTSNSLIAISRSLFHA